MMFIWLMYPTVARNFKRSVPQPITQQQYFENTYTDIAIDYQNNTYYVSAWGSLYR